MGRLHQTLPMLCILLSSGCSHSRFDPAVEGRRLLQRDAEWSRTASEGKDIDKILSYWSDDAQVFEPGQPVYQGKAAIRKYVSDSLNTPGLTRSIGYQEIPSFLQMGEWPTCLALTS